jgi:hypothetical protein
MELQDITTNLQHDGRCLVPESNQTLLENKTAAYS